VFAAVFGMGGAFPVAGDFQVDGQAPDRRAGDRAAGHEAERWLVETVRRQARAAGIGMPEVAIYDAPEVNAFATGMRRNAALVAVSTGLLSAMNRDEPRRCWPTRSAMWRTATW